jgi:signal transduction histidine kinase
MNKQRILVVEDHHLLQEAMREILETEGFEVFTAGDGLAALDMMQETCPDLILSDIMMPQMDGYEFYEKMRENPQWVRIPFIFLTAKGDRDDILKGKALGVEDYLTKPFDTQELLIAIHSRLKRAHDLQTVTETEFDQLKQHLIDILSHELRTPLTYISGYTELALDDVAALTPETLQEFLVGIKRGADRLNRLTDDFLMVVQIDTGQAEKDFKSFARVHHDLGTIINHTTQYYQMITHKKDIAFVVAVDLALPPVKLHEGFFSSVLNRLIDNAIKFSRQDSPYIEIRTATSPQWVQISVTDHGVGIAEEDIAHIFQRFQQIDRDKMEQQGTGQGLYIAQSLIQLHSGKITVASQPGEGSTFTIHLPIVEEIGVRSEESGVEN